MSPFYIQRLLTYVLFIIVSVQLLLDPHDRSVFKRQADIRYFTMEVLLFCLLKLFFSAFMKLTV